MRIFLTGATGYVGSAVLDALLRAGHDVTGLVRDAGKGRPLTARGVALIVGDLSDPASYRDLAEGFDGYVHTALDRSEDGPDVERTSVETLLTLATKPRTSTEPRVLVYTSGLWVLGRTSEPADEDAPRHPPPLVEWRSAVEDLVLARAKPSLRTAVIRPGIVYGGCRGIVSDLLKAAGNGLIRVIGDGQNHWPLVYARDLGDLYARVVADPEARGMFHANDEGDERVQDLAEAMASHLSSHPDIRYVPLPEARNKLGPLAEALVLDQRVRSPKARALGWTPSLRSVGRNLARLFDEFQGSREESEESAEAR